MDNSKKFLHGISNDIPAAIVVFLVALPLCLGIALASGAPLFSGIIAGIVGGIVVGSLSGSPLSISGPAAGLSTIVAAAILKVPAFEAFLLAVVIAGVFQIILGFLKAGIIGDYIPGAVIKGMLAAIGVMLIIQQFPLLIGYVEGNFTAVALLIGVVTLAFQFGWEKLISKQKGLIRLVQGPLLVVLMAVGINSIFMSSGNGLTGSYLVNIPQASSASEFFSFFSFPDWSQIANKDIWITAVTLAIVASLETLLGIEAIDELDPYQRVTPTNRELKAQGVGNIVSGLIGGLPLTSVIVRSSANVNAGAKSKKSTIFHGLLLLASVAFIPSVLNLIPKAALASILIFTGYKLAKPALFKMYFRKGYDQFMPFVITIGAILLTDLLIGVIIGIGVGLLFVIRANFKSSVFIVNDNNQFLFRMRKDVSFLNKPIIKRKLEEVPRNASVLIDLSRADFVDKDVVEVIEDFGKHAPLKNIRVQIKWNDLNKHKSIQGNGVATRKLEKEELLEEAVVV